MKISRNEDLERAYRELNDSYFGGKLPEHFPIRFGKVKKGILGRTCFKIGQFVPQNIVIKKHRASRYILTTLIHEMIHVKFHQLGKRGGGKKYSCDPPRKGKWGSAPWAKEVRRLARMGLFDWII